MVVLKDQETFMIGARMTHGDKYIYDLFEYAGYSAAGIVVCREHGAFRVSAAAHVQGKGCSTCIKEQPTKEFIAKAKKIHGDKYRYYLVKYRARDKDVKISCGEHGVFSVSPEQHLNGDGCPKCLQDEYRQLHYNKPDFDPYKGSVLYVYTFGKYAGFGITTNFKQRNATHLSNISKAGLDTNLYSTYNMPIKHAQQLEYQIKKTLPITNTGIDGFKTEAVGLKYLPELIEIIHNYMEELK